MPHPLEPGQLDGVEGKQIGRSLHQPLVHQLLDNLVAKAVHVHGTAGGKVLDRLLALGFAKQSARAAGHSLPFQPLHRGAAHRALGREQDRAGIRRALRLHHGDNLRDHIPRPAHDHGIADHDAEPLDLVGIVQSSVGDCHTADKHRFELGHRGHGAGATNLELDVLEERHLLLRREFVGGGPARGSGHKAQLLLQGNVVDLVDHAINLVRELATAGQDVVVEGLTTGRPFLEFHLGTERQSPGFQLIEAAEVGIPQLVATDPDTVGIKG